MPNAKLAPPCPVGPGRPNAKLTGQGGGGSKKNSQNAKFPYIPLYNTKYNPKIGLNTTKYTYS